MAHQRKLLVGLVLVIGVVLAIATASWVAMRPTTPFKVVLRGSNGTSGELRVSGGNLVVVPPAPGVYFGTVRKPGEAEPFTYVILFRYGRSRSDAAGRNVRFHSTIDGRTAQTTDAIDLQGKTIEAAYHVELDDAMKGVTKETLSINGRGVDMAAGRVFLVDLEESPLNYRQKAIALPAIGAPLESTEQIERLAEAIRAQLATEDAETKAFLR